MKKKLATLPGPELDDLLERDPFFRCRSDVEIRALEQEARDGAARPYWHLLRLLLGVGDGLDEPTAHGVWRATIGHRHSLQNALGRAVSLRTAALDWLSLQDEGARPIFPLVMSRAAMVDTVKLAQRDALTGLLRPDAFRARLSRHLKRRPFRGGMLVFIDLDGFKALNDKVGHAAGDVALQVFSAVALRVTRRCDLVGRVGGDEFALVLEAAAASGARKTVLRLRQAFESEAGHGLSFSFGATALRIDDAIDTALGRADASMYRQKRRRRAQR